MSTNRMSTDAADHGYTVAALADDQRTVPPAERASAATKAVTTAYGQLGSIVRQWSEVNNGELNRIQTRELLRALDNLHGAESAVQQWMNR